MSLVNPENVKELIEHCKQRLGEPMITVNITEMQCHIRVKEAIRMFVDYHYASTETAWVKQEITSAIKANKQIEVPDFVVGVNRIMNMKRSIYTDINSIGSSIFAVLNRNLLSNVEYMNKVDVYLYEREISEWENIWRPVPGFRFNRTSKNLQIDTGSHNLNVGDFLMYQAQIDLSQFTGRFFSDDWLIRYTTCLFDEQQGINLSKINNANLPSGIRINSQEIAERSSKEKALLLEELRENAYAMINPVSIG